MDMTGFKSERNFPDPPVWARRTTTSARHGQDVGAKIHCQTKKGIRDGC